MNNWGTVFYFMSSWLSNWGDGSAFSRTDDSLVEELLQDNFCVWVLDWPSQDIPAARRKMWGQDQRKDYHRVGLSRHAISWWETKASWMTGEVTCLLTLKSSTRLKWTDGWMKLVSHQGHGPAAIQYVTKAQCDIWTFYCWKCFLFIRCDQARLD